MVSWGTLFSFSHSTQKQHQHFNVLLNGLKTSPPSTVLTPLDYTHLFLVDSFYPSSDPSSGPDEKIRVTRDERTGEVKECVKKIRLGDLNIYCPKRVADWRISVNVEIPGDSFGIPQQAPALSWPVEQFPIP